MSARHQPEICAGMRVIVAADGTQEFAALVTATGGEHACILTDDGLVFLVFLADCRAVSTERRAA